MQDHAPDSSSPIPDGYQLLTRGGKFLAMIGPLYERPADDGTVIVAMRIGEQHGNMRGMAHGGLLATLADSAFGFNMMMTREPPAPMITVNLSTDYLSAAKVGDWLEARVHMRRVGRRLAFAECVLSVGDREVSRSTAVFTDAGAPTRPGA